MGKLKIEAGKYYLTRGGQKAFVAAIKLIPKGMKEAETYPVEGYVLDSEGEWNEESWTLAGCYMSDADERGDDLVAIWKEAKRLSGWVLVFGDGSVSKIHPTRAKALKSLSIPGFACVELSVVEGEGLAS